MAMCYSHFLQFLQNRQFIGNFVCLAVSRPALPALTVKVMAKKIHTLAQKAERLIIYSLVIMMAGVLVLATIELAYNILLTIINPPYFLLDFEEVLGLFGIFLLVLIGIELLDTIKIYFKRNVVHVEVVVLVAIIAIARKVIVLEPGTYDGTTLIGIAAIILALAVSYYLIKKLGSEMINFRDLPKSSQKVIADDIKESKIDLVDDDLKVDLTGSPERIKDPAREKARDEGNENSG
jgi:uncharacterized membrane protein (DUF373 family)